MKNVLLGATTLALLFSCNKTETQEKNSENNVKVDSIKPFAIDSVKVDDSIAVTKMITVGFQKQLLVFPSIENKSILDSIYQNAQVTTSGFDKNSLQENLNKELKKTLDDAKKGDYSFGADFKQTWYNESAMKVVSNTNQLLTLSYFGSGFTGGAHGYYTIKYKVFDLKSNKVLQQSDVFNNPKDPKWSGILLNHFKNKEQKEMLLVDNIDLNNNFYFDDKQITFVYNQYEITAYAAGVVEISIPFETVKSELKQSFLERLKPLK